MTDTLALQDLAIPVAAVLAGLAAARFLPRLLAGVPFTSPQQLARQLEEGQDILVVDVREPGEFNDALGHIRGAMNLPLGQVSSRLAGKGTSLESLRDTPVCLVCRSATRAASAARTFKKAGFSRVSVLTGGMMNWKRAGLPVA